MSEVEKMLEQLEISIEEAKEKIALRDSLTELHNNKHFKALILDGYIKEEASRICLCMADAEFVSPEKQESLHRMAFGIGSLFQYFRKIHLMGDMAEQSLKESEETRIELMQ